MKLGQDIDGIQSAGGRVSKDEPLPLVSLQDVSLGYDSTPVLHGVNVTISPGDLIGVAGPNGSGKTTLFRAILGLLPFSAALLLDTAHYRNLAMCLKAQPSILTFP